MRRQNLNRYGITLGLVLLPGAVLGLPEDRNQPIELRAERGEFNQKTGVSVFQGNVVITQGTMRLTADTVTVFLNEGRFQRMEAVGAPATLRYKPAVDKEEVNGTSQRVDYDAVGAKAVMTTNARITQGKDSFSGDRIEYDITNDVIRAAGRQGERIQFTIQPKSVTGDRPKPAAPKSSPAPKKN